MTHNILIYKFTWDLKLQNNYIAILKKAVGIMDEQTPQGAQILERIKTIFDKWQKEKINDNNMHGVYKDIEDILDEYEPEQTMEAAE